MENAKTESLLKTWSHAVILAVWDVMEDILLLLGNGGKKLVLFPETYLETLKIANLTAWLLATTTQLENIILALLLYLPLIVPVHAKIHILLLTRKTNVRPLLLTMLVPA